LIIRERRCKSLGVTISLCAVFFKHHFDAWAALPHLELPIHFPSFTILLLTVLKTHPQNLATRQVV